MYVHAIANLYDSIHSKTRLPFITMNLEKYVEYPSEVNSEKWHVFAN